MLGLEWASAIAVAVVPRLKLPIRPLVVIHVLFAFTALLPLRFPKRALEKLMYIPLGTYLGMYCIETVPSGLFKSCGHCIFCFTHLQSKFRSERSKTYQGGGLEKVYSSPSPCHPRSHANISALSLLEWPRSRVERTHVVFEERSSSKWNGKTRYLQLLHD